MKKVEKKNNIEKEIKTTLTNLLDKLNIKGNCTVVKEADNHYKVTIDTQETGLLIGHYGETLNSLQLLLGVILYKKLGNWVRVILDIGDYRKMREESIKGMVGRIVGEVEATDKSVILPYLTPLERRIVHLMLTNHPKVTSESIGEGRDRRVAIKPR